MSNTMKRNCGVGVVLVIRVAVLIRERNIKMKTVFERNEKTVCKHLKN